MHFFHFFCNARVKHPVVSNRIWNERKQVGAKHRDFVSITERIELRIYDRVL